MSTVGEEENASEEVIPQAERQLLAGAERRIGWAILALIPVGVVATGWFWGVGMAGAFGLGGVLAYLNYRWVVSVVDTMVRAQNIRPRGRDYLKLFAPLVLLGLLVYVIFATSLLPAVGVVSGVLLLVPAVFVEAIYQIFLGVRQ